LLRGAETVFVTGSGDPFASKNFRRLIAELNADDYPNLRFLIMTNAMLFTRRQWEQFPTLHRRVRMLKVSVDAATGPTHERIRRGARWDTMLENMIFAGQLVREGQVEQYELTFTVQAGNFREMGDAVDLAKRVGATSVYFGRITNWGTFSPEEYAAQAVFRPDHPDHSAFLETMRDPRLLDPMVALGNLRSFTGAAPESGRAFATH
jgi:MoaA/NifB/PqqE/SkfB family radical SAM enzyme